MANRWDYTVDIDRDARVSLSLQIARSLVADIRRRRLQPGGKLPGSRRLAATLGVHRNTVLAALTELEAEGWIETVRGRGTFVSRDLPDDGAPASPRRGGARARTPPHPGFTVSEGPAPHRSPGLPRGTLNLSSGAPDVRLVPARAIGRAYRRILGGRATDLLGYGDPEGHPVLRDALACMLATTRGLAMTADDICVTRGSQMALALAARGLLQPGDAVAVERLGYRPAWEAFRAVGATLHPVRVDRDGMDVDALAALARRVPLRAVYVTPHHQYPTTVTLKAARRMALLALARRERIAIIEDDYDHEFHFEGRPVLPLAAGDHAGVVIYVGTLSKIFVPALRLGYLVAPGALLRKIAAIRSHLDLQGDHVTEAVVAALIEDGELQRHVARMRRVHALRREVLIESLRRTFGDAVTFTPAPGGMALWVRFRTAVDVHAWATRSLQHGVSWFPGRRYAFDGRSLPFARFTFASLNERELVEAVRRLAAARGV